MPKPKILIEKGRIRLEKPVEFNDDDPYSSVMPSSTWASTISRFSSMHGPRSNPNQWREYKPTPEEIMRLSAERIEALRKKGKTEEEIQVIVKDFLEDIE
jgi:hypothetical protein